MSFDLLNPWMLAGLAGVALPVLAHLLSKRRYDVVQWGAMQFLDMGKRTRRRIRLEELLLLLLRMALLAIVAIALSRPWASGGPLSSFGTGEHRNLVIAIDGSGSMAWEGAAVTPHAKAMQRAFEIIETLRPGDTVSVLDVRGEVQPLIEPATSDFSKVRRALSDLPAPGGVARLEQGVMHGLKSLLSGRHPVRQLVVLTDGQQISWSAEDDLLWARIADIQQTAAVPTSVVVWDVDGEDDRPRANFSIGPVELSREITVPNFPMQFGTTVRQTGGAETRKAVHFSVGGHRVPSLANTVTVPADGEAAVSIEHEFPTTGSYLVAFELEDDPLPSDNVASAAVRVEQGLPVLLVDGDWNADPTQRETFFLEAAFAAAGSDSPWVQATVIAAPALTPDALNGQRVVILANVSRLSAAMEVALLEFVQQGGGLIIAPGDRSNLGYYRSDLIESGLAGVAYREVNTAEEQEEAITPSALPTDVTWLARFAPGAEIDFTSTRIDRWWQMDAAEAAQTTDEAEQSAATPARTLMSLSNDEPLLVSHRVGEGRVLQLAIPLDDDWSTLPARNDFVPFVHELVFQLAAQTAGRNLVPGLPIILPVDELEDGWRAIGPDDRRRPVRQLDDPPRVRVDETNQPGVYRLERENERRGPEHFVVRGDRQESDLTPLQPELKQRLAEDGQLTFVSSEADFQQSLFGDPAPVEFWWLLLLAVLGLLIFEVAMTRRLVQGGHEALDLEDEHV